MTRREAILAFAGQAIGDETTAQALQREFSHASFLLLAIRPERPVATHWENAHDPAPAGSLLKPFSALAYGEAHGDRFPTVVCTGCWKPDGHGALALREAVAFSCNAYFMTLARECSPEQIARCASSYGLPPPRDDRPQTWIGLGSGWVVRPLDLLRAYAELASRAVQPGPAALLSGMRLSAHRGTSRTLGLDAFAKTGTAPCVHKSKGSGDGYSVALFPVEAPRYALLTSLHDHPGAEAARVAGRIIRRVIA